MKLSSQSESLKETTWESVQAAFETFFDKWNLIQDLVGKAVADSEVNVPKICGLLYYLFSLDPPLFLLSNIIRDSFSGSSHEPELFL